jgi:hypothetical protein
LKPVVALYASRMASEERRSRRLLSAAATAVSILFVLLAYVFFASGGTFSFRRIPWNESLYASLAEGFRNGHLYMAHAADPRLMALPYPYDFKAREGVVDYVWDASYLNGRYYLYFSPLPALVFYMPYRALRGAYPRDSLAAVVFAAWAFLAAVAFTRRALKLAGSPLSLPFPLWILVLGLGNVATFLLTEIRMYEVAVFLGTAMTATWAYALLRFVETPTVRQAVVMGVWLAMSIAARPNVGVLVFVSAAVIVLGVRDRRHLSRMLLSALVPLAIVASAMLWYNKARFNDPFEFGIRYQLTFTPMEEKAVCGLHDMRDLSRFLNSSMHYVFWPPTINSRFPFIRLQYTKLDPAVSFPMPRPEEVAGVVPLVPLTSLGTFFAAVFALRRQPLNAALRSAIHVMAGAWLILFGISTCWWVVTRYDLDFMVLMLMATVVCVEAGLVFLGSTGVRLFPMKLALGFMACYSALAGLLLGFSGEEDAFHRLHPELFQRISGWFQ